MKKLFVFIALCLVAVSANAQDPALGYPPFSSFADGGFDSVNRQNLNAVFTVPTVFVPGRGLHFGFGVGYNSLVWRRSGNAWVPVTDFGWIKEMNVGSLTHSTQSVMCRTFIETEEGGYWETEFSTFYYNFKFTDALGGVHSYGREFYTEATLCEYSPLESEIQAEEVDGYLLNVNNDVFDRYGTELTGNSVTDRKLVDIATRKVTRIVKDGPPVYGWAQAN